MFITAVKTAIVEALIAAFATLGDKTSNTTRDLTPNSVTIDYPMAEVQWPAILVQFRPRKVQWIGLNPDAFTSISGSNPPAVRAQRYGYFEGNLDFQILAMHSEERDRLWDSLFNLVLMNPGSPAAFAFYESLKQNDLVAITLQQGSAQSLGDTISPGTPFSPEELTYEASIRLACVGEFYESKYDVTYSGITGVTVSGFPVYQSSTTTMSGIPFVEILS
jgi:hypothetical protein